MDLTAEQIQATKDIFAYVDSLDLPEVLGELAHIEEMHARVSWLAIAAGIDTSATEGIMLHVVLALSRRLIGLVGVEAKAPGHDGALLHSCTLVSRLARH